MMCLKSDPDSCTKAAALLREGKILILPTDTVYGFSGIVDTPSSGTSFHTDDRIRKIKGREGTKPLIQLIASPGDIRLYTDDLIPKQLLEKWPGALTIIVRNSLTSGRVGTTAYRCPGDLWLRRVISLCGGPIYSTSVNRSGFPVLDTVSGIVHEFEAETDLIITAGDTEGALPSTLVSVEGGSVRILRQGNVMI